MAWSAAGLYNLIDRMVERECLGLRAYGLASSLEPAEAGHLGGV